MKLWALKFPSVFWLLCVSLFAAPTARAGLIGLYQFNDPSNLGLDSTNNHNNLVVLGSGVSYTSAGEYGGGLSLTGSGGLTTLTGAAPGSFPLGNSDYTISAWFQTPASGALGIIGWGNYGAYDQVNALRTNGDGLDNYWWGNDLVTSGNYADNGNWYNGTVTFNGTTRDLYFNGALIASDSPGSGHNVTNYDFAIGRTCPFCGSGEYFNGTLDNVAVFDQPLTQSQVDTVATGNFAAFGVPEPGTPLLLCLGLLGVAAVALRRRPA